MRTKRIGFALIAVYLSTAPLGCGAGYYLGSNVGEFASGDHARQGEALRRVSMDEARRHVLEIGRFS